MLRNFLLVALGGAAGSMLRYAFTLCAAHFAFAAEWSILAANVAGSFLIGVAMGCTQSSMYLLLAVGFCGGFTTFSTFSAQALALLRSGQIALGLGYVAASLILCLAATAAGLAITMKNHP